MTPSDPQRRPLATRERPWAIGLARAVAQTGLSPNAISLLSLVWAAGAGLCLALSGLVHPPLLRSGLLLVAAACIQLRLLCNMLDGMVALTTGRRSATGDLFNELPDRVADVLILVGAGYGAVGLPHASDLGWLCGSLAVLTAYIRALGQALGAPALFSGPMAKPQRMAAMTLGALAAAAAVPWNHAAVILQATLVVIAVGSLWTCLRRVRGLARHLESR